MNRADLQALPLEERRRIQRESGLVTASFVEQGRSHQQQEPNKKEQNNMDQQTSQQPVENTRTRARRTVEDFLNDIEHGEPMRRTATKAGVYAAIWAPVAIGVGYTLLRLGRRMFVPTMPVA